METKKQMDFEEQERTPVRSKEGVYVYFRSSEKSSIMVVVNQNEKEMPLQLSRYREMTTDKNFQFGKDIV